MWCCAASRVWAMAGSHRVCPTIRCAAPLSACAAISARQAAIQPLLVLRHASPPAPATSMNSCARQKRGVNWVQRTSRSTRWVRALPRPLNISRPSAAIKRPSRTNSPPFADIFLWCPRSPFYRVYCEQTLRVCSQYTLYSLRGKAAQLSRKRMLTKQEKRASLIFACSNSLIRVKQGQVYIHSKQAGIEEKNLNISLIPHFSIVVYTLLGCFIGSTQTITKR